MVRSAGRGREIQWRMPIPKDIKNPIKIPLELPIEMITRAEWAAAPRVELDSDIRLKLPINHIRYTFTDTDPCADQEECIPFLRQLQKDSQEKGYPDLMYNFLIGSDGMLYEGRGFDWKCTVFADPWVDTKGESMNIAYIGRFHNVVAPWQFRLTSKKVQKWMLRHSLLHELFEITPSMCWPDDFSGPAVVADSSVDLPAAVTPEMMEFMKRPDLPIDNVTDDPVVAEDPLSDDPDGDGAIE